MLYTATAQAAELGIECFIALLPRRLRNIATQLRHWHQGQPRGIRAWQLAAGQRNRESTCVLSVTKTIDHMVFSDARVSDSPRAERSLLEGLILPADADWTRSDRFDLSSN